VTKTDITATATGLASATALGMGMDMMMALIVGGLTSILLLLRIALAVREWRKR
jgi:hypothetical protein